MFGIQQKCLVHNSYFVTQKYSGCNWIIFTVLARTFWNETVFFSSLQCLVVKNALRASKVWCHYLARSKALAILLTFALCTISINVNTVKKANIFIF